MKKEYRVEVLVKNGVWQPIGYDDVYDSYDLAVRDMNFRIANNRNHNRYRIAFREVSDWIRYDDFTQFDGPDLYDIDARNLES